MMFTKVAFVLLVLVLAAHAQTYTRLNDALNFNKRWSRDNTNINPNFFTQHSSGQSPKIFWLGCSDSRVHPSQAIGLSIGEVFVYRNVANFIDESDIGPTAALQFSILVLGVTDVFVVGHTKCGGIKASLDRRNLNGPIQQWIMKIRKVVNRN